MSSSSPSSRHRLTRPTDALRTPLRARSPSPMSLSGYQPHPPLPTARQLGIAFGVDDETEKYKQRFNDRFDVFVSAQSLVNSMPAKNPERDTVLVSENSSLEHAAPMAQLTVSLSVVSRAERVRRAVPPAAHPCVSSRTPLGGPDLLRNAPMDGQVRTPLLLSSCSLTRLATRHPPADTLPFIPPRFISSDSLCSPDTSANIPSPKCSSVTIRSRSCL